MALKVQLNQDMKSALKARGEGKTRLGVLRLVLSEIKNREVEKGRELDDEEVLEVLARELKQRQEALPDYERSGRTELVQRLKDEAVILAEYLPEPLGAEELERMVREVAAETGAQGVRDLGKVMKAVIPRTKGRAEGSQVKEVAERILADFAE